jgi:hypothetical protein
LPDPGGATIKARVSPAIALSRLCWRGVNTMCIDVADGFAKTVRATRAPTSWTSATCWINPPCRRSAKPASQAFAEGSTSLGQCSA